MPIEQNLTGEEALAILATARKTGRLPEGFIEEQLQAMRGGIQANTHARVETAGQVREKRELTPEQTEQFINQLRSNFDMNNRVSRRLHPNTKFEQVERTLRLQPEVIWSLSKMEETGGKVDVIEEDNDSFLFGDTSSESPADRRNVVFDAPAEKNCPNEQFSGNAADRVNEWGVDFMDEQQYRALQTRGDFDAQTRSWLKTSSDIRQAGHALVGFRYDGFVGVRQYVAYRHAGRRGFRCALRVLKKS